MRIINRRETWLSTSIEKEEKTYSMVLKFVKERLAENPIFETSMFDFGENIIIGDMFHEIRENRKQLNADGFAVRIKRNRNRADIVVFKKTPITLIRLFFCGFEKLN